MHLRLRVPLENISERTRRMKAGILIGHLKNTRNESAIIRTAEAFGINHVFCVGTHKTDISNTVARGCQKHVSFHHLDSYEDLVWFADSHNYNLVVIENTPDSQCIENGADYPANPIFITGHESKGIPGGLVENADRVVKIDQSPNSYIRCLNTATACEIVMHDWYNERYNRDKTQEYE